MPNPLAERLEKAVSERAAAVAETVALFQDWAEQIEPNRVLFESFSLPFKNKAVPGATFQGVLVGTDNAGRLLVFRDGVVYPTDERDSLILSEPTTLADFVARHDVKTAQLGFAYVMGLPSVTAEIERQTHDLQRFCQANAGGIKATSGGANWEAMTT